MNKSKQLISSLLLLLPVATAMGGKRPNVLLVVYDDLRPEIGAYGAAEAITPNIDQLAAEGTRFDNAYVNYPLCLPSRASLLTGLRFDNSNFAKVEKQDGKDALYHAMLAMQTTWPQVLHDAGYWTATRGKLYHGNVPKLDKGAWDVAGYCYGDPGPYTLSDGLWDKIVDKGGVKEHVDKLLAKEQGPGLVAYLSVDCGDSQLNDGAVADDVVDYLLNQRDKAKPFFITAGFSRPHLPWIAPKKYFDLYPEDAGELAPVPDGVGREIPRKDQRPISSNLWNEGLSDQEAKRLKRAYMATTSYADAQMGRIIETLKQAGEYDNTIIVLWGDHGYHLSEHGLWQKNRDYRVALRCPLIIKAPGMKGGQSTRGVVQNLDIYPTVLALAGVEKPADVVLHGRDLSPLLKNPEAPWDHVAHVSCVGRHGIVTDRYRFTDFGKGAYELYDAKTDPGEWINLAGNPEHAGQIEVFKKQLKDAVWNRK